MYNQRGKYWVIVNRQTGKNSSSTTPASSPPKRVAMPYTRASAKPNAASAVSLKTPAKSLLKGNSVSPSRGPLSPSPSGVKKRRQPSKYAPPSKYAHLKPLTDILEANLICVFVGTNPGVQTATAGHAYAHPSNLFWKLLHSSGCTGRRLRPEEDVDLPRLYRMGNTNIVDRPSKDAAELSKDEMTAGAAVLEEKFAKWRPETVCIVGKGIWEAIWRNKKGKALKAADFKYGWQDECNNMGMVEGDETWKGSRVFVATSTSGLAASMKPAEKEAIWKVFGEWVKNRREELAGDIPSTSGEPPVSS
ncbi:DNA glycosylase [Aulographum hederae CBS 113979]|uniref:DNA glycosylase n=1 Tax=Aulographum hederae CBS 113979 TaxID=1176131 RepID=A0A6G1GXQ1_9PEZI|nr:DNA glycosylase [Aulographum hederae CBS 113979]